MSQARRSEGDAADDRAAVPDVRLVDLARRFADVVAVDGVSLDVARGEFFTLLGPSASGKTTTLRLIAGFELPDGGRVELAGTDVTSRPAYARDVNTVFQDYALFPHMTVLEKGLLTIIIGHATFCIVVVFNNVVARLRRTSRSFEEASADLGASPLQTFRYVMFPQMRSALVAGALLAFALSFDEVIVTTFTAGRQETLPIWILANLSRPRQLPIVNVVAVLAILLSLIPVWIAQRITADPVSAGAARAEAGGEAGA